MKQQDQTENPMHDTQPFGRLVMIVEKELSEASEGALRRLLADFWPDEGVTMVSGLNRAGILQAGRLAEGIFYNSREYLSPEQAFRLMPWREIWLVAAGRVWRTC